LLNTVLLCLVGVETFPFLAWVVFSDVQVLWSGDWVARCMWTLIAASGIAAATVAVRAWQRNTPALFPIVLPGLWTGAVFALALVWPP
jgi:hypothetical protein